MRARLCAITLAVSTTLAGSSFAQSASRDAAAQQLFDDGRALMASGRYAEACKKFDASDRLSPAGGTLLNLADCYEKAGKTASAWAKYNEAADRANAVHKADAEQFARDHAKILAGKLSYLKLVVAPGASATNGLVIQLDGVAIDRQAWNVPLPVDPGAHEIAASAPHKKNRSSSVDVAGAAVTQSVSVSDLEDDTSAASSRTADEPPAANGDSSQGSAERVVGLSVAAVGVVGLGVGTVFGIIAKNKHDQVVTDCPGGSCTSQSDVDTNGDSKNAATLSTVAFIAGGAFLAGGVVLYLVAPKSDRSSALHITTQAGSGGGRLLLQGSF
jgi:hypothetical protein